MTKAVNILRVFLILLLASVSLETRAQKSENVVILWDVTGSLLPTKSGVTDPYSGQVLPTYSKGNGLFVELKEAVMDCIRYVEEDPSTQITVVTFHDYIRDRVSRNASSDGKEELLDFVKSYKYQPHKYTNIVDPIRTFYGLIRNDKINYMFLFTDGDNDHPETRPQLIPTLNSWESGTGGRDAYGFYVLVHPDADQPDIRQSVESQDNYWIVPNAKVRIKTCTLPSTIKYNVRDDKGPKQVNITGKFKGIQGNITLNSDDQYYEVSCSDSDVSDGVFSFEVKPKSGVTPPSRHDVMLTPQVSRADEYTFVCPAQVRLEVMNIPERSLNLTVDSKNFGDASYYDSFCGVSSKAVPVNTEIKVEFSDQARKENSSARMNVFLVDRKGEQKVTFESQKLDLCINGKEATSVILTPDMTDVTLSITGNSETKGGNYYARIELIPTGLDNCLINSSPGVYKCRFSFKQRWNPLKLGLAWGLVILMGAFLLWMIVLRPIFYPRFGSIQKVFNVPGFAPLIIKFKGARMVVLAASHPKKQSLWNRFWTGKIIYKTHPAFSAPIKFKPSRGKRVLTLVQAGTYHILPNPMPGIGSATITDIRTNKKITIN